MPNDKIGVDSASTQIAVETARDARRFLGKVFGSAATEFEGMLGDQMRYWRFKNMHRILSRAEEITKARDHETETLSELPFGDAIRTIEAASYEEEESVQDLWATLIANAVDPNSGVSVKKIYVDLLQSISFAEAAFLELIGECEKKTEFADSDELNEFNEEMNALAESKWRKFDRETRNVATQNLVRLRCINHRSRPMRVHGLFGELPDEMISPSFDNWSLVNPQEFEKVVKHLGEMVEVAAGIKDPKSTGPVPLQRGFGRFGNMPLVIDVPEMNFMLTALGKDLLKATKEEVEQQDKETKRSS